MNATQICDLLDADLVTFIHNIIVVIKIAVPIILVIFGMLDLAKGVVAGKEDEIKKGQQVFIKRLIAAAFVFFVITIVQLVMGLISSEDNSFWNCADQILNGNRGYFTDYGSGSVNNKKNNSNNENKENDNSNNNTNTNNENNNSLDNNSNNKNDVEQDGGEAHTSSGGFNHGGGGGSTISDNGEQGTGSSTTSPNGFNHGGGGGTTSTEANTRSTGTNNNTSGTSTDGHW